MTSRRSRRKQEVWTLQSIEECLQDLHYNNSNSTADTSKSAAVSDSDTTAAAAACWLPVSSLSLSSFLPQIDEDWLLDGKVEWLDDELEAHELVNKLYTGDSDFLQILEDLRTRIEEGHNEEEEEDNDAEFGDFQSASPIKTLEGKSPVSQGCRTVDLETIGTPVLDERADSILGWIETLNNDSGDDTCDTLQLVKFSDELLEEKKDEESAEACNNGSTEFKEMKSGEPDEAIAAGDAISGNSENLLQEQLDGSRKESGDSSLDFRKPSSLRSDCHQAHSVGSDSGSSSSCDQETLHHIRETSAIPKTIEAPSIHYSGGNCSNDGIEKNVEVEPPISLLLPVEDLTSPEGKFTRRRQLNALGKSRSDQELDLPAFYYTSKIDDTIHVLQSLPWKYLEQDALLWDETIESRLCQLDASLNAVQSQLLSSLSSHDLEYANSLVHEWQMHLSLALMYHDRTAEGIHQVLDNPDGSILTLNEQRDDCRDLQKLLVQIQNLLHQKDELLKRIDAYDASPTCDDDDDDDDILVAEFSCLSQLARDLQHTASQEPLLRLHCLDDLRAIVQAFPRRFWKQLLTLCQSAAIRACYGDGGDQIMRQYQRLLKVVLEMQSTTTNSSPSTEMMIDFTRDWSRSITECLCYEADRALAMALIECHNDSTKDQRILNLYRELESGWGDVAKIRNITHNLVIICFQLSDTNLALVCHNLMVRIWKIFRTHVQLMANTTASSMIADDSSTATGCSRSHGRSNEFVGDIHSQLLHSRSLLWDHCEVVVVRLLSEYLHFSTRPNLFEQGDESAWSQDLECLQQVLVMVERFLSLQGWFLSERSESMCHMYDRKKSELYERLTDVFRRHLRNVHVEAMNSTGRMLSGENWVLSSTKLPSASDAESLVARVLSALGHLITRAHHAPVSKPENIAFTDYCPSQQNPFGTSVKECVTQADKTTTETSSDIEFSDVSEVLRNAIPLEIIASLIETPSDTLRVFMPRCVTEGLLQWTGRLVTIITKLPLIVEDVSAVLANLCDLHFTTVFRLCCGCAKQERLLLGSEKPCPYVYAANDSRTPKPSAMSTGSPLFSSFRKGASNTKTRNASYTTRAVLPVFLDADICAPVLKDLPQVLILRSFLQRAQTSFKDVVNLDKVDSWLADPIRTTESAEEVSCCAAQILERREGARWSCFIVALVAAAGLFEAQHNLSASAFGRHFIADMLSLRSYVRSLLAITPTLSAVAGQFASVRAVSATDVVKSILLVDYVWEECRLHEHPNDYVYELVDKCSMIWGFLCLSGKLPFAIRKTTWEYMLSGAYLALLEGFARISGSSTEGRALMTLDLATFSEEMRPASVIDRLDGRSMEASLPPLVSSTGLRLDGYVETYIKVFYFPKEDALSWIKENYGAYQQNQLVALVREIVEDKEDQELIEHVKMLYMKSEDEYNINRS